MSGVEPDPPRCKRGALPVELHPRVDADGWSRTTTARGDGVTGRWARRCPASAGRSGGRPDLNRRRGDHDPECCHYTTATAGTAGLEPAASRLTSERSTPLSYAPMTGSRGRDSNPRSRAHEAREDNRSSTAQGLAGRTRTCDPRLPGPVGWPAPPQPDGDRHHAVGIDERCWWEDRVYFLAFSLAGPDDSPYREVDQRASIDREHPRRDSNPQPPG